MHLTAAEEDGSVEKENNHFSLVHLTRNDLYNLGIPTIQILTSITKNYLKNVN